MTTSEIYRLPCTLTGLDAELDNCDPGSYELLQVSDDDCLDENMTRYITLDGVMVDCSIDPAQWADWFGEELELVGVKTAWPLPPVNGFGAK